MAPEAKTTLEKDAATSDDSVAFQGASPKAGIEKTPDAVPADSGGKETPVKAKARPKPLPQTQEKTKRETLIEEFQALQARLTQTIEEIRRSIIKIRSIKSNKIKRSITVLGKTEDAEERKTMEKRIAAGQFLLSARAGETESSLNELDRSLKQINAKVLEILAEIARESLLAGANMHIAKLLASTEINPDLNALITEARAQVEEARIIDLETKALVDSKLPERLKQLVLEGRIQLREEDIGEESADGICPRETEITPVKNLSKLEKSGELSIFASRIGKGVTIHCGIIKDVKKRKSGERADFKLITHDGSSHGFSSSEMNRAIPFKDFDISFLEDKPEDPQEAWNRAMAERGQIVATAIGKYYTSQAQAKAKAEEEDDDEIEVEPEVPTTIETANGPIQIAFCGSDMIIVEVIEEAKKNKPAKTEEKLHLGYIGQRAKIISHPIHKGKVGTIERDEDGKTAINTGFALVCREGDEVKERIKMGRGSAFEIVDETVVSDTSTHRVNAGSDRPEAQHEEFLYRDLSRTEYEALVPAGGKKERYEDKSGRIACLFRGNKLCSKGPIIMVKNTQRGGPIGNKFITRQDPALDRPIYYVPHVDSWPAFGTDTLQWQVKNPDFGNPDAGSDDNDKKPKAESSDAASNVIMPLHINDEHLGKRVRLKMSVMTKGEGIVIKNPKPIAARSNGETDFAIQPEEGEAMPIKTNCVIELLEED